MVLKQVVLDELAGGQVDRHRYGGEACLLPGEILPARGLEHPFADRHDEAAVLGDGDELVGRNQPALVAPAQQASNPISSPDAVSSWGW